MHESFDTYNGATYPSCLIGLRNIQSAQLPTASIRPSARKRPVSGNDAMGNRRSARTRAMLPNSVSNMDTERGQTLAQNPVDLAEHLQRVHRCLNGRHHNEPTSTDRYMQVQKALDASHSCIFGRPQQIRAAWSSTARFRQNNKSAPPQSRSSPPATPTLHRKTSKSAPSLRHLFLQPLSRQFEHMPPHYTPRRNARILASAPNRHALQPYSKWVATGPMLTVALYSDLLCPLLAVGSPLPALVPWWNWRSHHARHCKSLAYLRG